MGLLTNPKARQKVSAVISKYHNKLCALCYVVGLGWFLALAHVPLNAKTYFSENALLPGLVDAGIHQDYRASDLLKQLKDTVQQQAGKTLEGTKSQYHIPSEWLADRFRELGLDTYVQNYTFKYPGGIMKGKKFPGQNVYGILRAPRASSTEALVLSAPFRAPEGSLDKTAAGIALMLGLAKAFRRHTYWAKDIIFLVTEYEQIGMQAWLSAYHYHPTPYIFPGELYGRSGAIQAALNLEIGSETISKMNIKLEGLNGQLPNLDLVNTVVRLCRREKIPSNLQKRGDYKGYDNLEGFHHALKTMLLMMWNQAPGTPTGNHGLFHRYHIEAVTLQGVKMKNAKKMYGYVDMGRVVEGVMRSLNNLLERFHQSFFFYLLPATDRYVSIGLYMPPFGVLAAPILIKQALALWISSGIKQAEREAETDEQEEKNGQEMGKEAAASASGPGQPEAGAAGDKTKSTQPSSSIFAVIPNAIMALFFAVVSYVAPSYFVETASALHMPPGEGLVLGVIAIHLACIGYPVLFRRKASQKPYSAVGPGAEVQKCLSLLMLGLLLGATSVMNISLAFFLAATWGPVVTAISPSQNRLCNWLQYIMLLVISPLGLFIAGCTVHTLTIQKLTDPHEVGIRIWENAQSTLLQGYLDSQMFGNWTLTLVTLGLLPNWSLFWSLLWTQPL